MQNTPKMLIKVDIEKAYDMLDQNVVLANLRIMQFSKAWISWVRACITSASYFFLLLVS